MEQAEELALLPNVVDAAQLCLWNQSYGRKQQKLIGFSCPTVRFDELDLELKSVSFHLYLPRQFCTPIDTGRPRIVPACQVVLEILIHNVGSKSQLLTTYQG